VKGHMAAGEGGKKWDQTGERFPGSIFGKKRNEKAFLTRGTTDNGRNYTNGVEDGGRYPGITREHRL